MAAKEKTHVRAAAILGGTRIWARLLLAVIAFGAICNIAQAGTLATPSVAENSPLGLGRISGAICVGVEAIQARRTHQENAGFLGETASDDAYATRGAIGSTGRVGEQALKALGGESQVFFRTSQGGRFVDQLVKGIAHESKVGYTTLTKDAARQIAKDVELIGGRDIQGSVWHFFQSPATGVGGPSGPLRQALENAGIGVVLH